MLKIQHSVNLRWKYFYKIGSCCSHYFDVSTLRKKNNNAEEIPVNAELSVAIIGLTSLVTKNPSSWWRHHRFSLKLAPRSRCPSGTSSFRVVTPTWAAWRSRTWRTRWRTSPSGGTLTGSGSIPTRKDSTWSSTTGRRSSTRYLSTLIRSGN